MRGRDRDRRSRLDDPVGADVDDELGFHIEGTVEELMAAGLSRASARAEAQRRFGDLIRIREECRTIGRQRERRRRRSEMLHDLMKDIRYTVRGLARNPGFALVAVLTLGLGIGATTAIFTVVDGVLLRPLPFAEPERLVMVWERNEVDGLERDNPSPPNFLDWREAATSFSALTAWDDGSFTLTGLERPEVTPSVSTTASFFDVFGVTPLLGRTFAPGEDDGGTRVVVLSHATWQRLYGGDATVLGRTMQLDGEPYEIIGVMPPSFRVPRPEIAVWVPRTYTNEHRQSRYLTVVGRLAPGVTADRAEQELQGIADRLRVLYPEANEGFTPYLVSVQEQVVGGARRMLMLVFAAVGFVLLLSCTNVANLVLGRATARQGEIAVRSSLGASRGRLRMQLITENLVLGAVGGVIGVAFAYLCVFLFLRAEPSAVPRVEDIAVDLRVLGFAAGTALFTGVLLGLVPAARATGWRLTDVLREGSLRGAGSRKSELTRRVLVIAEVAISLVLLVGAGLALRSLAELRAVDPGFVTSQLVASRVNLNGPAYGEGRPLSEQNELKRNYFGQLLDRVNAIPGVRSAGITSTLPLTPSGIDFNLPYHAEGHPLLPEGRLPQSDYRIASAGYFDAMGIEVVRGRAFNEVDRAGGKQVLIVNESFAREHWPGEDAIGKTVTIYYVENTPWEVVGVVRDTRHQSLSSAAQSQMFVPLTQAEFLFGYMTMVVRTSGDVPGLIDHLRDAAAALDPNEPLYDFDTIETMLADATARDRLAAVVFGLFALLALVLSAAGIYGVISYQVARRTREIGVRMALGASRTKVVAAVVGEAAGLCVIGVTVGLLGAAAATQVASGLLYGISAHDPITFASVSAVLVLVGIIAALVPAGRAAAVDPLTALRTE